MEILLPAIGLFLFIEGVPYFIAPGGIKRLLEHVREIPDRYLRIVGFVAMLVGLALLYLTLVSPADAAGPKAYSYGVKNPDQIRIAISKDIKDVTISGKDLRVYSDGDDVPILIENGYGKAHIRGDYSGIKLNGLETHSYRLVAVSNSSFVNIGERKFRGKMEVISDNDRRLTLVNNLGLESYLKGLINAEFSSRWAIEAVKAQAVVARSYAIYQKRQYRNKDYDLESSILDQVYRGSHDEDDRARLAVNETKGEVLTYNGKLFSTYYHSCCGGKTELAQYVWGTALPFSSGVPCEWCVDAPYYFWTYELSLKHLQQILNDKGLGVGKIKRVYMSKSTPSRRALVITIEGKSGLDREITGNEFRKIVGFTKIKSTLFELQQNKKNLVFYGSGSGHGVGLCQWGAKGMAEGGYTYKQILKHYYPGSKLVQLY